jgi:processive 1,2-diacylglycerol beta-glucosyltransferase
VVYTSKILIISGSVGSGHDRAAQALELAIKSRHPNTVVEVIDVLSYAPRGFAKIYGSLWMWKSPQYGRHLWAQWDENYSLDRWWSLILRNSPLVRHIKEFNPNRIICTHFLSAKVMSDLRLSREIAAPLYVTLTDYDVHSIWFHESVDRYFVGNEEMKSEMVQRGIDKNIIDAFGIPINPVFSEKPNKDFIINVLELDKCTSTTLVLSRQAIDIERIVDCITTLQRKIQILVVAGRNSKLKAKLEKKEFEKHITLKTFGFVNYIQLIELMEVSDIAITKAGGLTISECLAKGLPMLVAMPFLPWELKNSNLIIKAGAAVRANDLASLGYQLKRLLDDRQKLNQMRQAALSIAHPDAAFRIADKVMEGEG